MIPLDELAARFVYRDFRHFLDVWTWKDQFLRDYEDFTFVAEHVARDLASQNIRYVEMFYSPGDHAEWGLEFQSLTRAIRDGLDKQEHSQALKREVCGFPRKVS